VLVFAGGLAVFMYPMVFIHPDGNAWTLRAAFVGCCAITFVVYLFDRQRSFTKIKEQLLCELERNVELQIRASTDQLRSMPDQNHFWDRLTMEFRRALSMEKTLSLVLVKVKPGAKASLNDQNAALSDSAKSMSKRLRPTDSIYRLTNDLFGIVLPETDTLNAERVAYRLQEELQAIRSHYGATFDLTSHNCPEHLKSSHEFEDIVKSMLLEQEEWQVPAEAESTVI
jgi:GGDEF domain-containing protein